MRRREFIALGCGSAIWPFSTAAQETTRVRRIGWLVTGSLASPQTQGLLRALWVGLGERGYTEGRDIVLELRAANGNFDLFPKLAIELIQLRLDLIIAGNTATARAVRQATEMIPILVPSLADPVADGLVASLGRPGGNITGLTFLGPELVPKQLEVLLELFPNASRVGGLWHPSVYGEHTMRQMLERAEVGAKLRNVTLHFVEARKPDQLVPAFLAMTKQRADAIVVFPSPMFFDNRKLIAELAIAHGLPAVFNGRDFVEDGGLVSYGANLNDLWRRAGGYVDRILKGAKPGDLPVEQPTKFELVINLKTAKALGLTIPPTLLARADEVIE